MPTPYIKKLSKEGKGSVPSLEKKWDDAKDQAKKQGKGTNYGYITNIFKKMSHASTSEEIDAFVQSRIPQATMTTKLNAATRLQATEVNAGSYTMGDLYRAIRPKIAGYTVSYKDYGKDGKCVQLRKGNNGYNVYMDDRHKPLYLVTKQKGTQETHVADKVPPDDLEQFFTTGKL